MSPFFYYEEQQLCQTTIIGTVVADETKTDITLQMERILTLLLVSFLSFQMSGEALTAEIDHVFSGSGIFGSKGGVDLIIIEGIAPYIYSWSNGETTEDLSLIDAGEYCVTVTDALCGEATACFIVSELAGTVDLEYSGTDLCLMEYGDLTVYPSIPGFEVQQYYWFSQPNINLPTINVAIPGYKSVLMYGLNGGSVTSSFYNIDEIPAMPPFEDYMVIGDVQNAQCSSHDGSIQVTIQNSLCASIPSQVISDISWGDGVTGVLNRDNLAPGTYEVELTVYGLFDLSAIFTVEQDVDVIDIVLDDIIASECQENGPLLNPGSIDIHIQGVSDYSVLWSFLEGQTSTEEDVLEAFYGPYTIEVFTSNGCYATRTFDMCCCFANNHPNLPPSFLDCTPDIELILPPYEIEFTSASGPQIANGSITIPTSLPIQWTGPGEFVAYTTTINGLLPGEYCYTIFDYECETDLVGLTGEGCITLVDCSTEAFNPNVDLEIEIDKTCHCEEEGVVSFSDLQPYQGKGWTISMNAQVEQTSPENGNITFNDLEHGFYTFLINDPNGCEHVMELEVEMIVEDITITTDPCQKIISCGNCDDYYEVSSPHFDYINCNYRIATCELTGEVIQSLTGNVGYAYQYINWSHCEKILVCQTGVEVRIPGSVHSQIGIELIAGTEPPYFPVDYNCVWQQGCLFPDGETFVFVPNPNLQHPIIGPVTYSFVETCWPNSGCIYEFSCDEEVIGQSDCIGCITRFAKPDTTSSSAYSIHPNPFNKRIYISSEIKRIEENFIVELFDMRGERISNQKYHLPKGEHESVFDIQGSSISPGLYIVKIADSNGASIYKVIHENLDY